MVLGKDLLYKFPCTPDLTCPQETQGHPAEEQGVHAKIGSRMGLLEQWLLMYSSKEDGRYGFPLAPQCRIWPPLWIAPSFRGILYRIWGAPWCKCLASCLFCYKLQSRLGILRKVDDYRKHKKKWKREKEFANKEKEQDDSRAQHWSCVFSQPYEALLAEDLKR